MLVVSCGDSPATQYVTTESVLLGLTKWAQGRGRQDTPLIATHVHALYPPAEHPRPARSPAGKALLDTVGKDGFLPIVAMKELAGYATQWFSQPAAVLGDALTYSGLEFSSSVRRSWQEGEAITITFLGGAAWRASQKGLGLLPHIVEYIAPRFPRARFKIQVDPGTVPGRTGMRLRSLLPHPAVETIETHLEPARYYRSLLQQTHIVLLPYDPEVYGQRSSGIFAEAMASGGCGCGFRRHGSVKRTQGRTRGWNYF